MGSKTVAVLLITSFVAVGNAARISESEQVGLEEHAELNSTRVGGTRVSKAKAPFLFRWVKEESPIQGILWCAASKGEMFNLGQCTAQDGWSEKTCVLRPYLPNVAMYPDKGFISRFTTTTGYFELGATTTYKFADDFKHADGVISLVVLGEMLYSRATVSGTDPDTMHQRWTWKKGDTVSDAVLEGDYFRVIDEHGIPTHHWNQYISTDETMMYNVDTSFYNERMTELSQELGVPEDDVWTTLWSNNGIDPTTGLKDESG